MRKVVQKWLIIISVIVSAAIEGYPQCVPPTPATITTPQTTVCIGQSAVLTSSIQGISYFFEWYKGNTLVHSGIGRHYMHIFVTEPGPYKVRYYVINNPGCFSPFSNEITFTINLIPTIQASPIWNRICSGQTTNITLSSDVPNTTFTWTVDPGSTTGASDGSGSSIAQTITNTYTGTNWENVSYYVRGTSNGCISNQVQTGVSVHPVPKLQAISPTTICEGGTVDLSMAPSGGYFERNGSPFPNGTPWQSGNYTYNISVPGTPPCVTTSAPMTVTVLPTPSVTITFATPTTLCAGESVALTANTVPLNGNYDYEWKKNSTFVGTDPSYSANSGGTYSVKVTNRDCNSRGNYLGTDSTPVTMNSVTPGWVTSYPGNLDNPAQILCERGDPTPFGSLVNGTATGTMGTQWKVSYDGINYSTITGATGATYDAPSGITQTSNYIRVTSSTLNSKTCYANSNIINVIVNPSPSFTPGTIQPVCSSSTPALLPYTNLTNGTDYRIDWATLNDFSWVNLPASPLPISNPGTGIYTGTIYLRSGHLCESIGYPITLTVNSRPTAAFTTPPTTHCLGASTPIGGTITANGAWTLTLSNGGGSVTGTGSGTWSKNVSPTTTTTYSIVSLTDANCSAVASDIAGFRTLTVIPSPTVSASAMYPSICLGSSTPLNASGANTYSWSPSTGLSSTTGAMVTATPTSTTTYTVTGTAANGCVKSATVTVTVNSLPVVSVNPPSPSKCPGSSAITLTASGAILYNWSPSTGLSATKGSTVTANPTTTTTYTVSGTNSIGCVGTRTVTVTVNPSPSVPIITNLGSVCDQYVTLTANASGATSYQWSTGNTLQTVNMVSSGTYTVTAFNSLGCSRISNPITITIPTCDGDPCDPFSRNAAGREVEPPCFEEIIKTELIVTNTAAYPNPADEEVILHLPSPAEYDIRVKMYSQFGQVVHSTILQEGEYKVELDTKHLTGGMYLIQLELRGQRGFNRRILVAHNK